MKNTGLRKLNSVSEKYRDLLLEEVNKNIIVTEVVTTCENCGSSNYETILNRDRFNLPFGANLCVDCGLIYTSPRIKEESLACYYNKYYHPLNYGKESLAGHDGLFGEGQGKKVYEFIRPYIDKAEIDVIEIGAGVGNVVATFRDLAVAENIVVNASGTEYSDECISQCEAKGINMIAGDVSTVSTQGKKYDVVILSHVFEHFVDLQSRLDELSKMLYDDGVLYIEVPGVLKIHNKPYYDFSLLGYAVHAHMYNFTLHTLESILSQNGFTLLTGNEDVSAIFKLSKVRAPISHNDYSKVKFYIEFLNDSEAYFLDQHTKIKALEGAIEGLSRTIDARGEVILEKENMINEKSVRIKKLTEASQKQGSTIESQATLIESKKKLIDDIVLSQQEMERHNIRIHPKKKYDSFRELQKKINEAKKANH